MRYTRGTKSTTHQRGNPGTATPWNELSTSSQSSSTPSLKVKVKTSSEKVNDKPSKFSGGPRLVKLFGQFWVPNDEAKRLQKLIVKLKGEGLSRKVISESLRNEIRRAEKKAKRSKDKTCFSCRQYGHLLIDCPNTKANTITDDNNPNPSGNVTDSSSNLIQYDGDSVEICFKCGSIEHTSRKCTKNKNNENYKFAKCFICQNTGHISRQCPENKHGIYPTGGSCNECGESGHLAKDCPKANKPDEDESMSTNSKPNNDGETTCSTIFDPMMSTEYEPIEENWHKVVKKPGVKNPKKTRNPIVSNHSSSNSNPSDMRPINKNNRSGKKRLVKF